MPWIKSHLNSRIEFSAEIWLLENMEIVFISVIILLFCYSLFLKKNCLPLQIQREHLCGEKWCIRNIQMIKIKNSNFFAKFIRKLKNTHLSVDSIPGFSNYLSVIWINREVRQTDFHFFFFLFLFILELNFTAFQFAILLFSLFFLITTQYTCFNNNIEKEKEKKILKDNIERN